jgi:2'-5' RNA ligase
MLQKYSIVFQPTEPIIEKVKALKQELSNSIGWYHSKNALAHITICELTLDDSKISSLTTELTKICEYINPVTTHLNSFSSFPNGAFFIKQDEVSSKLYTSIMKTIHSSLAFKLSHKSTNPHLSIARKLTPENVSVAYKLFPTIDLKFICDTIAIRELDNDKGQYQLAKEIKLEGKEPIPYQGVLF